MEYTSKLFEFIKKSPTAYHAVDTIKKTLVENGFTELFENDDFSLSDGGKYFAVRNGSSLIAFKYSSSAESFMIAASHSDSPSFKVKCGTVKGVYSKLDVEKYGGMIYYSWLDRPLSVAGRVFLKSDAGIEERLINIDKDIAVIPSLAVHMNRGVNDGLKLNPAVDMLPLVSASALSFEDILKNECGISADRVVSHDLFLYNREEGKTIGAEAEFILSPRLDDLECVFASLSAFVETNNKAAVPVIAVFDNEEVGSETKQGAASTFLYDILSRIGGESLLKMLPNSFMVSADNAHSRHPNHPELSDQNNAPVLNGGVVIKYNANQRYTTDAYSEAVFNTLAERTGIKLQKFSNRADMPGGSTLGSISNTKVSLPTVDIGLAQLAMHSASETSGVRDLGDLIKVLSEFYSSRIQRSNSVTKIIK